jgi:hypothetical protein
VTEYLAAPVVVNEAHTLLTTLVYATAEARNIAFEIAIQRLSPREILNAALERYNETANEQFLLYSVSLLENAGRSAWPALRDLAQSKVAECELFVPLIAKCTGVTEDERFAAIKSLATCRHAGVKSQIFEELWTFSPKHRNSLLQELAKDKNPDVRERAEQYLVDWQ